MSSGTPTPNLGLHIRTGTDDYDFNEINADNTTIDEAVAFVVCTSATRPTTGLFAGRRIYETDTSKIYVWDGSAWVDDTTPDLTPYDLKPDYIANAAARPTTGLYTGRMVYENDVDAFAIYMTDTSSWVYLYNNWRDFTPTFTNFTLTAGYECKRKIEGKTCTVYIVGTIASSAAGNFSVNIPITSRSYIAGVHLLGHCFFRDASAGAYMSGIVIANRGAAGAIPSVSFQLPASATNTNMVNVTNTAPVTWAVGDDFSCRFEYEIA